MMESSCEKDEYGDYDDDDSDIYGLMTYNQAITQNRYPDVASQDLNADAEPQKNAMEPSINFAAMKAIT